MVECSGADHWMDNDVFVESKKRYRPKQTRKEIEKINGVDQDNKSKALERLYELAIPKSDQSLLAKLISKGYLISVDKILFRKKKSLILSGKSNQKHRIFPLLSTDDVIIKIPINGTKEELWQRASVERHQNDKYIESGDDQPTFLLQTGHILVTSMIGNDGEPAPTLTDVLRSNRRNIVTVYDEVIQFWCKLKNLPFHPSNYLYHNGKWCRVGYGGPNAYDCSTKVHPLAFYRANLKNVIDFFCQNGLNLKQAEEGFMKYAGKHYWGTTEVMRGMTRKRSFFSIMYMGQSSDN
ncbi:hypothetical protein HA402_014602 [Bradysia odoriphaga]|nr:hypothetical protein HA402_014602 [Bradysia odoriphaga]